MALQIVVLLSIPNLSGDGGGWRRRWGRPVLGYHVSSHCSDRPPQLAQQQQQQLFALGRDTFRLKHTNRASKSGKVEPPRPREMYTITNQLIPGVGQGLGVPKGHV